MLTLQNISYKHNNSDLLFDNIGFTVNNHEKIALIGNNGVGKSTLLKIIAGELKPSNGDLRVSSHPYYIPQIFGQYNHFTIAEALRVHDKLKALKEILVGNVTEENLNVLNDDWTIEERCSNALKYWQLSDLDLNEKIENLSGGQKTKVFLAGILIHEPELVLLDEPSNHLDKATRELLYHFITSTNSSLIIVSHDRKLLNLLNTVYELSKRGITIYGGNYDFYAEQKQVENNALNQDLQSKEKALKKAKEKERETLERQQKLDARGKKKQEKSGVARIMMNTLRNNAENSSSKLKSVHVEKIDGISKELREIRSALPDIDQMKFGFDDSGLHKGKILFKANAINFSYKDQLLWKKDLNIEILSGERIALKGSNGSGKTTLIKIILGKLNPKSGTVYSPQNKSVYIDQDYSLINNELKVYDQAQQFNGSGLEEHEIKMRLNRFLFHKEYWDKPCNALSGGEKMRLMLCCLTINNESPDIIVLDEPTNNLDIQNVEILTAAINEYQGTLIVVSHDESFLEQINIQKSILL
ncbi:ribosomal protection-like ABC-F family protein [Flavobacterium piscisymbiosum]|uniref:ATP-binding cassette domain-containing protein n=1 Tax=Flavobacterium piscisymbiosum TaxID=2893753 RepID=A0ABS8MI48_9FLAO|nr:ABC-F family ATP-binding cassette domain-containing protein [Flavobacterium sp. F-30]MCC9065171.1 ATP-binding cassette domain-containing protein [Flavobacterium sp. F-30]